MLHGARLAIFLLTFCSRARLLHDAEASNYFIIDFNMLKVLLLAVAVVSVDAKSKGFRGPFAARLVLHTHIRMPHTTGKAEHRQCT